METETAPAAVVVVLHIVESSATGIQRLYHDLYLSEEAER